MNSAWQEIERIYSAAAELPPDRQEAFVRAEANPQLAAEILDLLAAGWSDDVPRRPVDLQDLLAAFNSNFLSGRSLGPYDIGDLLGEGGMGLVYRAVDRRHRRTVAIKVLPPEQTRHPGRVARLVREAAALAKLNHPSIVQILDSGSEGELHYLVMEYLEGETLHQRLRAGPLREQEARTLGVSISGALAEAHAAGVTHRDLKPENIMMTEHGVKLLDFGIAHLDDDDNPGRTTLREALSGTVAYLAPEQIEGEPATPSSDLFALGVVLFEAYTGRHPFQRANPVATAAAIVREQPALHLVPSGLRPMVGRCLQKKPDRRYSSAWEMWAELTGSGQPVRRRRWLWAAIGVAACASCGVAVWVGLSRNEVPQVLAGPGDFDHPALSSDGRWLAYGAQAHIWVQAAGSGQPAFQVSFLPGKDSWPSLSPDGRTLVYEHAGERSGIYRIRLRAGKAAGPPEWLMPGYKPCFSPGGRKIAFENSPLSVVDPHSSRPDIRVVASEGPFAAPVAVQLIDGVVQPPWIWEPGDRYLLVIMIHRGSTIRGPYRGDSEGGKPVPATDLDLDQGVELSACGMLPSGTLVGSTPEGTLIGISSQGMVPIGKHLPTPGARATGCQILPDGRLAAFLSDTRRDIWEVRGGSARATGLGTGFSVSATHDGRWLAWLKDEGAARVGMLRDPSGTQIELPRNNEDGFGPKLAPDGSAVLLKAATASGHDWDILSLPGRQFLRRIELDSVIWSVSNGARWLLQVGTPKIPRSIGVFITETRVVDTILVDPKLNLYLAALSPDERWVVFTGEADGQPPRIFVAPFNPKGLIPREQWVEIGTGDYPAWNPAGNRIYYLAPEEDRILSIAFDPLRPAAAQSPAMAYRFAPGWGLKGLPPGAFRIAVTPDRVLFNLARRESVVELGR